MIRKTEIVRAAAAFTLALGLLGAPRAHAEPPSSEESAPETTPTGADTGSAEAAPIESSEVEASGSITRGLSWNLMAGGIPSGGALIEAALGFSGLPRVAYHYTMSPALSIGGMVSFDYAYWLPDAAFRAGLLLQAPIRMELMASDMLSIGLRADPGVGFAFDPGAFSVLLNVGVNAGYTIENRMIVGGGLDVPMALFLQRNSVFVVPLLVGPIFEYHVTPPLALTADVKVGPYITTRGTDFGFKLMAGIAYRL